jgi:putative glutamine amidotransferase
LGSGLLVTARAREDGVVEALEHADAEFVIGVQWHPEADERSRIIAALVEQARNTSNLRATEEVS